MKFSQRTIKLADDSKYGARLKQIEVERTTLMNYLIDNLKGLGHRRMLELLELIEDLELDRERILAKFYS